MADVLSKSQIMASRQCHKRLWLDTYRPELAPAGEADRRAAEGVLVGEIARRLFDPSGAGVLVDVGQLGVARALKHSQTLLDQKRPIFEAGLSGGGAQAFADVLLPVGKTQTPAWKLIEVKSSTSAKDHYRDEVAFQAFVAKEAGLALRSVSLAHIDSSWTYPGDGRYEGLLIEVDLTKEAAERADEVRSWIETAVGILKLKSEPEIGVGGHCNTPYDCPFFDCCDEATPKTEFPVGWLPRVQSKALKAKVTEPGVIDMRHVPDELLNERQLRVKSCTITNQTFFDQKGAKAALSKHKLPAYFLDFETVNFAVPRWAGVRPYQQIPFQFSLHIMSPSGELAHQSFLDLSGDDPCEPFAKALISACGKKGPVFVYNAGFERSRINELAVRFASMARALTAIADRLVDLHPIAQDYFYAPSQQGSWSIKAVLPAVAPNLSYESLDVQHGEMAIDAYIEAIDPTTTSERRTEIEQQLVAYCRLDTLAMVRIWALLAGSWKFTERMSAETKTVPLFTLD